MDSPEIEPHTREAASDEGVESPRSPAAALQDLLPPLLISVLVVALYVPALQLGLAGDDYLLVQLARQGLDEPLQLMAPLGSFFRPTTNWTLAADWLLWGAKAEAYHLLNVLLRCFATSWLLYVLARRLCLGPWLAGAIAAVWACSPLSAEPVYVIGARIDELLLLLWLALLVVWPRYLERRRSAVVGLWVLLLLAALSKESWVVIPATLSAFSLAVGRPLRTRVARELPLYLAAGAYVLLYFVFLPGDKGYLSWDLGFVAKAGHQMAAFWQLETLCPIGFELTWKGVVALGLTAAALGTAVRLRSTAGLVGGAVLIAASLPTLLVTTLPSRHTSIPFAGFVLLIGGLVAERRRLPAAWASRMVVWTAGTVAALALVAGAFTVRADLIDAAGVADAHRTLEEEWRQVAAELPLDRPVVVVRAEQANPLLELALASRGVPKYYFVRHRDAYGLTDTAAVVEWVLGEGGPAVRADGDGGLVTNDASHRVLVHRLGGFEWAPAQADTLAGEQDLWQAAGCYTRVIWLEARGRDGTSPTGGS